MEHLVSLSNKLKELELNNINKVFNNLGPDHNDIIYLEKIQIILMDMHQMLENIEQRCIIRRQEEKAENLRKLEPSIAEALKKFFIAFQEQTNRNYMPRKYFVVNVTNAININKFGLNAIMNADKDIKALQRCISIYQTFDNLPVVYSVEDDEYNSNKIKERKSLTGNSKILAKEKAIINNSTSLMKLNVENNIDKENDYISNSNEICRNTDSKSNKSYQSILKNITSTCESSPRRDSTKTNNNKYQNVKNMNFGSEITKSLPNIKKVISSSNTKNQFFDIKKAISMMLPGDYQSENKQLNDSHYHNASELDIEINNSSIDNRASYNNPDKNSIKKTAKNLKVKETKIDTSFENKSNTTINTDATTIATKTRYDYDLCKSVKAGNIKNSSNKSNFKLNDKHEVQNSKMEKSLKAITKDKIHGIKNDSKIENKALSRSCSKSKCSKNMDLSNIYDQKSFERSPIQSKSCNQINGIDSNNKKTSQCEYFNKDNAKLDTLSPSPLEMPKNNIANSNKGSSMTAMMQYESSPLSKLNSMSINNINKSTVIESFPINSQNISYEAHNISAQKKKILRSVSVSNITTTYGYADIYKQKQEFHEVLQQLNDKKNSKICKGQLTRTPVKSSLSPIQKEAYLNISTPNILPNYAEKQYNVIDLQEMMKNRQKFYEYLQYRAEINSSNKNKTKKNDLKSNDRSGNHKLQEGKHIHYLINSDISFNTTIENPQDKSKRSDNDQSRSSINLKRDDHDLYDSFYNNNQSNNPKEFINLTKDNPNIIKEETKMTTKTNKSMLPTPSSIMKKIIDPIDSKSLNIKADSTQGEPKTFHSQESNNDIFLRHASIPILIPNNPSKSIPSYLYNNNNDNDNDSQKINSNNCFLPIQSSAHPSFTSHNTINMDNEQNFSNINYPINLKKSPYSNLAYDNKVLETIRETSQSNRDLGSKESNNLMEINENGQIKQKCMQYIKNPQTIIKVNTNVSISSTSKSNFDKENISFTDLSSIQNNSSIYQDSKLSPKHVFFSIENIINNTNSTLCKNNTPLKTKLSSDYIDMNNNSYEHSGKSLSKSNNNVKYCMIPENKSPLCIRKNGF